MLMIFFTFSTAEQLEKKFHQATLDGRTAGRQEAANAIQTTWWQAIGLAGSPYKPTVWQITSKHEVVNKTSGSKCLMIGLSEQVDPNGYIDLQVCDSNAYFADWNLLIPNQEIRFLTVALTDASQPHFLSSYLTPISNPEGLRFLKEIAALNPP